jgi:hypothetical protein
VVAAVSQTSRASTRVLVAGALLIGAAWALSPAPSPPLYDGLSGPAQPFVYLDPPAGYHQTGKPSGATRPLTITAGSSTAGYASTAEIPPQAQVLAADGTFSTPPGATSVTLAITPVEPPQPIPSALGRLAGNLYHVTATADVPGPVGITPAHPVTVVLRGPAGTGNAPIARLGEGGGSTWQRVTTVPLGSAPDMVVTNTEQLGWFAITATGSGSSTSSNGGGGGSGDFPVGLVLGISLPALALAVVIVALLMRASQQRDRAARRRRR